MKLLRTGTFALALLAMSGSGRERCVRAQTSSSLDARERTAGGPARSWELLGPFGGPAEAVVTSPSTPGLLLSGSPNGLLFRSEDAGLHWKHLPFPAEQASTLHAIAIDPRDARHVLAAVSPDHAGAAGLYRSGDGGETWLPVDVFRGKPVWALAFWPGDPHVVAAGASDGVHLSENGGVTWKAISPPANVDLRPVVALAFHPANRRTIYAGTPHLPWKTSDGGVRWRSIHTGMIDDSDVFTIDVDSRRPDRVFASACSGMYRSLDGGATWAKLRGSRDASFRTYAIARDPHHENRVWAGTTHGLMRSDDSGLTWRALRPNAVKAIAFDAAKTGTVYLATRDAGLLKTIDGGETFTAINDGFTSRNLLALAAAPGGLWAISTLEAGSGLLQSATGALWKRGPDAALLRGRRVLMVGGCADPAWAFAGGAGFLLRSAGLAMAWMPVPLPGPRGETVRSIQCSSGGTLLATSARNAYTSSDQGAAWKPVAAPAPGVEWYGLAGVGGALVAATSHGLFRSADGGATWQRAEGDLGASTVSNVVVHPSRAGTSFAAQFDKVFVSADQGRQWRPLEAAGLQRASIRALAISAADPRRLYALVAGRGVFQINWE